MKPVAVARRSGRLLRLEQAPSNHVFLRGPTHSLAGSAVSRVGANNITARTTPPAKHADDLASKGIDAASFNPTGFARSEGSHRLRLGNQTEILVNGDLGQLFSEKVVRQFSGQGKVLPRNAQDFFAPSLGNTIRNVRIHDDRAGNIVAGGLRARAVTIGKDIFFAPGEYEPRTIPGLELVAHELAHVIQQQDLPSNVTRPLVASPLSTYEKEAERYSRIVDHSCASWHPPFVALHPGPGAVPIFQCNPLGPQALAAAVFTIVAGLASIAGVGFSIEQRSSGTVSINEIERTQAAEVLPFPATGRTRGVSGDEIFTLVHLDPRFRSFFGELLFGELRVDLRAYCHYVDNVLTYGLQVLEPILSSDYDEVNIHLRTAAIGWLGPGWRGFAGNPPLVEIEIGGAISPAGWSPYERTRSYFGVIVFGPLGVELSVEQITATGPYVTERNIGTYTSLEAPQIIQLEEIVIPIQPYEEPVVF